MSWLGHQISNLQFEQSCECFSQSNQVRCEINMMEKFGVEGL